MSFRLVRASFAGTAVSTRVATPDPRCSSGRAAGASTGGPGPGISCAPACRCVLALPCSAAAAGGTAVAPQAVSAPATASRQAVDNLWQQHYAAASLRPSQHHRCAAAPPCFDVGPALCHRPGPGLSQRSSHAPQEGCPPSSPLRGHPPLRLLLRGRTKEKGLAHRPGVDARGDAPVPRQPPCTDVPASSSRLPARQAEPLPGTAQVLAPCSVASCAVPGRSGVLAPSPPCGGLVPVSPSPSVHPARSRRVGDADAPPLRTAPDPAPLHGQDRVQCPLPRGRRLGSPWASSDAFPALAEVCDRASKALGRWPFHGADAATE